MSWSIPARLLLFFAGLGLATYLVAVVDASPLGRAAGDRAASARRWFLAPWAGAVRALTAPRSRRRPLRHVGRSLAPWIAPVAWVAAVALVPVLPGRAVVGTSAALPALLAAVTIAALAPAMQGFLGSTRQAHLAGVRAAQQALSVWFALAIAVLTPGILAGTTDLNALGARWQWWWTAALLPVLAVYLVAACALLHRAPFTAPRARELGAHYLQDSTSAEHALHRFGELLGLVALAVVGAVLFLGGWAGPMAAYLGWLWLALKSLVVLLGVIMLRSIPGRVEVPDLVRFGVILAGVAALGAVLVAAGVWLL